MSDDELVTAYLDGVAELTPDERRRAEALIDAHPADADETKALLAELRALPPPADPDFRALEGAIARALPPATPRGYRWSAVSGALAAAATIALFFAIHRDRAAEPAFVAPAPALPAAAEPAVPPAHIYSNDDGDLDLDDLDDAALDEALAPDDDLGELADFVSETDDTAGATFGAQIDRLDDASLDRLDRWLASRKGG